MTTATVKFVQIDSLVVMKIVRHVETELYTGMSEVAGEACQGILTGMVAVDDQRLEITNCFPTARTETTIDDEGVPVTAVRDSEETKQSEIVDMLRKFRNMNMDYELVGFYQAHPFGACFAQDFVESLVDYQSSVQDGVVLIYDPVRTRQGLLTLRAYRLSQKALDLCYVDWWPETVKQTNLTFENMFEELPIVIKNSHLVNVLLCELGLSSKPPDPVHLQLGTKGSLEKCMRGLMNNIDDMNRAITNYNKYTIEKQRHDSLVTNLTQKRQLENEGRRSRGEQPLPFDDIKKMRAPVLQAKNGMLESFLAASQTAAHVTHAVEVAGENVAKLFVAESVAEARPSKERSTSSINVLSSSARS